jgi:uncharacterized protein involved in tolerance to divalent cations
MTSETVTLYLTVCDTEEASNIIGILTDAGLIISANITATSDLDHNFDQRIAADTEVTICITVEEEKLDQTMRKIRSIYDQGSDSIKIYSDNARLKSF